MYDYWALEIPEAGNKNQIRVINGIILFELFVIELNELDFYFCLEKCRQDWTSA